MEVFIYQESKELHLSISRGDEIEWPTVCRNCNLEYPSELKTSISRSLLQNPMVDLMKLTSATLQREVPKCNYCCINNFRPNIVRRKLPEFEHHPGYYLFSESLVIEDGLVDWYDVSWEQDEEQENFVTKARKENPDGEFSLFSMIDSV